MPWSGAACGEGCGGPSPYQSSSNCSCGIRLAYSSSPPCFFPSPPPRQHKPDTRGAPVQIGVTVTRMRSRGGSRARAVE